jgi:hypothetical protein
MRLVIIYQALYEAAGEVATTASYRTAIEFNRRCVLKKV